jgi:uncharacterized protein (UPF0297 family)
MSVRTKFPYLQRCMVTRGIDRNYNGVAWAMFDRNTWWDPDPFGLFYWPDHLPRQRTLRVFEQLFEDYGYEYTDNFQFESGYEKIVIYVLDGQPTHVARQEDSGRWTSKMDRCEEINHLNPCILESNELGNIATVLKRITPNVSSH